MNLRDPFAVVFRELHITEIQLGRTLLEHDLGKWGMKSAIDDFVIGRLRVCDSSEERVEVLRVKEFELIA
jgi:hypothetical protein